MESVIQPSKSLPVAPLLDALGLSRAGFYRYRLSAAASQPPHPSPCEPVPGSPGPAGTGEDTASARKEERLPDRPRPCPVPGRGLSSTEQEGVRQVLYGERFRDHTPTEIFATLLDEGDYLCSVSTMYRLLRADSATTTRSRAKWHTHYEKPELLATRPNQLWSWDITRLKGPRLWTYFYLYVIMDVFSRYVVGFMVAHQESQTLAKQLIDETLHKQGIQPGRLTIHADRGAAMTSKSVALLLSDLGVAKTHSRPHVSNDNPYSEAQFKTLKYRPDFPDRFGCIEDARGHCAELFRWYNGEHHHGGLALLTPAAVHHGHARRIIANRQRLLDAAFRAHPQRFVNRPPRHATLPEAVWINPPVPNTSSDNQV